MLRLFLFCLLPLSAFSQSVPYRKYKAGEVLRYQLTSESSRNGQSSGKSVSVSEHKTIRKGKSFEEEIRWLSKTSYTARDTVSLDSTAKSVKPYRVSLSPEGSVPMPKLNISAMVGEVTDLNTFLVAIAPALKAQQLSAMKPEIKNDTVRQGNFADSMVILAGTDCIQVTQQLLEGGKDYVRVRTSFLPPPDFCLEPLIDTIRVQTGVVPNNFQMIQKGAGDKVNLFWGVESFIIETKIDKKTGQIIEATMDNQLTLKMRYNASKDLKTYAVEMPIMISRKLKLELVL